MSPELTPILVAVGTVGVGLAVLMVGLFAWLRQDMGILRQEVGERIGQLESRTVQRFEQMEARINEKFDKVDGRFDRLENRLAAVEHGQAKLEGLLEGLREAIVGRRAVS